jgi:hypothetical protein
MTKEILDGIYYRYNPITGKKEKVNPIRKPKIINYCERCGKKIDYFMLPSSCVHGYTVVCYECDSELYLDYINGIGMDNRC